MRLSFSTLPMIVLNTFCSMPLLTHANHACVLFHQYLIHFFLEIYHKFSRFCERLLECSQAFSDLKIRCRTEVRSYPNNVPTLFIFNRSFVSVEPPEGLENVTDILTQFFLEISDLTATGAG
jgi:hypothetical protein